MTVHLSPSEVAERYGMERRDVIAKCFELGVPIHNGRIDHTLFYKALTAGINYPSGVLEEIPEGAVRVGIDYGKEPFAVAWFDHENKVIHRAVVERPNPSDPEPPAPTGFSPEDLPGDPPTMEQAEELVGDLMGPKFETHKAHSGIATPEEIRSPSQVDVDVDHADQEFFEQRAGRLEWSDAFRARLRKLEAERDEVPAMLIPGDTPMNRHQEKALRNTGAFSAGGNVGAYAADLPEQEFSMWLTKGEIEALSMSFPSQRDILKYWERYSSTMLDRLSAREKLAKLLNELEASDV